MSGYRGIVRALDAVGLLLDAPSVSWDELRGVTEDSRRVQPGWLFCANQGTAEDGHSYLPDAAARGAGGAIVAVRSDLALPQIVVTNTRAATAIAAAEWFDRPGDALALIGVTGTNGKSTTVALIQHVLNREQTAGSIGTLGAFDGRGNALYEEGLTTPGPVQLQQTLATLRDAGMTHVAMEVSSHALDQRRVDGLRFQVGVFTNLTHDHLDYHRGFDDYLRAKLRLAGLVTAGGVIATNADEPRWSEVPVPDGVRHVTFGMDAGGRWHATDITLGPEGTTFVLHDGGETVRVRTPLLAAFNVSNAVAAVAAARSLDVTLQEIVERLATAPQVAGRMEPLVAHRYLILRDYAHTPDALRRALAAARPLTAGRLVVLFGCGGDRDRAKRPEMGRIAVTDADLAIVTSDNPRTEDPERILDDIEAGMDTATHVRNVDRRAAITEAVGLLGEGDCLLLAGKGHETYQVVGTERVPFDEREIVLEMLGDRAPS